MSSEQDVSAGHDNGVSGVPDPGLVRLAHLIYGLHTISVLIGLTSAVTIVGSFVFGLPSIVAVVLNYARREATRGTWLESHFGWQIRTFWFAFLWGCIATLLMFTVIGIPLALGVFGLVGLWVVYRVVRGWLALNERRPMPV